MWPFPPSVPIEERFTTVRNLREEVMSKNSDARPPLKADVDLHRHTDEMWETMELLASSGVMVVPIGNLDQRLMTQRWFSGRMEKHRPQIMDQWSKAIQRGAIPNYGIRSGSLNDLLVLEFRGAEALAFLEQNLRPEDVVVELPDSRRQVYFRHYSALPHGHYLVLVREQQIGKAVKRRRKYAIGPGCIDPVSRAHYRIPGASGGVGAARLVLQRPTIPRNLLEGLGGALGVPLKQKGRLQRCLERC